MTVTCHMWVSIFNADFFFSAILVTNLLLKKKKKTKLKLALAEHLCANKAALSVTLIIRCVKANSTGKPPNIVLPAVELCWHSFNHSLWDRAALLGPRIQDVLQLLLFGLR